MDTQQLRELAGTPIQINEDVSAVARYPIDQIVEGLAIAILENNVRLEDTLQQLREAFMRSKNGRDQRGY